MLLAIMANIKQLNLEKGPMKTLKGYSSSHDQVALDISNEILTK